MSIKCTLTSPLPGQSGGFVAAEADTYFDWDEELDSESSVSERWLKWDDPDDPEPAALVVATGPGRARVHPGVFRGTRVSWSCAVELTNGDGDAPPMVTVPVRMPEVVGAAPTGYVAPGETINFSWDLQQLKNNHVIQNLTPAAGDLWIREVGTVTWYTYTTFTKKSYAMSPDTLKPGKTYEWKIQQTTEHRYEVESPIYKISTAEALSTAQIIWPKDVVVDGSVDNVFRWRHIIATGTPQTKYEAQQSPDGKTWSHLLSLYTPNQYGTAPAGYLKPGDLYWRVRTGNTDEAWGSWSPVAHCIVVAAPQPPKVSVVTKKPKFAISWQQSGQQAREIYLNGEMIDRAYGVDTAYTYPGYLPDGDYMVGVRIQNKFGMWSEIGQVAMAIKNSPLAAAPLTATVNPDSSVSLSWYIQAPAEFALYRNDKLIYHGRDRSYVDYFALGSETYQVRTEAPRTGDYGLSDPVTVQIDVPGMIVTPINNPAYVDLSKSARTIRSTGLSQNRSVSYQHYVGQALPSAEIGEYVDRVCGFDAAWAAEDRDGIAAFEALLGQLVCAKLPSGRKVIGILNATEMTEDRRIVSVTATITEVAYD